MKARFKILGSMLANIRTDLARPHAFAHERVGFITAGVAADAAGDLLLLARTYRPVDEEDYVPDPSVGVKIGPGAMRKALQSAYRPPTALLHVHTHGGRGRPDFSGVDRRSASEFVPSFFNAVPKMPHGIVVLSDDSAAGLLWFSPDGREERVTEFVSVGSPHFRFGATA